MKSVEKAKKPGRLLVVDWDFFFPNPMEGGALSQRASLYDWGHIENPFFIEAVWPLRASNFFLAGLDLPGTSGEEETFWSRFRIASDAALHVAESNADVVRFLDGMGEIWLFDAHADCGYHGEDSLTRILDGGQVDCGDWGLYAVMRGITMVVRYPRWKVHAFEVEPETAVERFFEGAIDRDIDDGDDIPVMFDRVFVCRSGAWVPPWLDDRFERFVRSAPAKVGEMLPRRSFDESVARRLAEEHREVLRHFGAFAKNVGEAR